VKPTFGAEEFRFATDPERRVLKISRKPSIGNDTFTSKMTDQKIYACVDYEDPYVQPLLLNAVKARIPSELLVLIKDASELPSNDSKFLQWRQYESLDFDKLMSGSDASLSNSYVIRKALIRKHYLSMTVSHWLTKNPESSLKRHVKPGVEFEVDFAEFLDDALIEAFELHESWQRNDSKEPAEREWWILKPGMSDRGQGIRLFSSEEELTEIFEEWDPPSDDEEEEDDEAEHSGDEAAPSASKPENDDDDDDDNGIMTSQLRHFVAQPYIDPPLLMSPPHPSAGRKFHIRTYVLAVGALKVYVYKPMLALFAGKPYAPPSSEETAPDLSAHLTNTCLQTGEREGSVHAFWSLPYSLPDLQTQTPDWREDVFKQICDATGQVFEAAARSMSIHFQPLPNAFELFGLDFMVDAEGTTWLMEVNAFPDIAQTGSELQDLVKGLMEDVVDVAIKPFFGVEEEVKRSQGDEGLVQVLDIDLGKR
jgi:tubulin--tyrosine ligase